MMSRTAHRVFEILTYKDSLDKKLQCDPNPVLVFDYMGVGIADITGEGPVQFIYRYISIN